jgi:peptidoglycan/LPS O-acetylase OafA/YrhL
MAIPGSGLIQHNLRRPLSAERVVPLEIQGRFTVVDALRGVAALAVVIFHTTANGKVDHIPKLRALIPDWLAVVLVNGRLGVATFFVLSGFVISHSLYNERVTLPLAGRFMLRRSLRLDPPYWVAIAFALGFAFLSAAVLSDKTWPDVTGSQVVAHLLYVQEILQYPEINDVFWTLCLELQFYLIYVLLLAAAPRKTTVVVLFTVASISLFWPIGIITTGLWPGSFLPLWHGFLLGMGAYWSWRKPALALFFGAFAFLVLVFSVRRGDAFSTTCAATACLLWSFAMTGQISTLLNWSWLQFLGAISYSLYLIHNPITGASFRVGYMLTGHSLLLEVFWCAATLVLCIIAATVLWLLVEKPSMRLARKIKLGNKPRLLEPGFRPTGLPHSFAEP